MIFTLEVLKALKGDCLILHYGTSKDPRLMLIDGGPAGIYKNELKPRLTQIRKKRIKPDDPLPIDVVMVSHIDDDHINGILELAEEQKAGAPDLKVDVSSLWFNSFDDILGNPPDELVVKNVTASILASADQASPAATIDAETEDQHQTLEVLSSVGQARDLRDIARAWTPNHLFDEKLIMATANAELVEMDGLRIKVVGPMQPELIALQKEHDKWLREHHAGITKSPEAMLAAFVDQSVPNLSSIVVLIEADHNGKTRKMLLTGDARSDKIMEGLKLIQAFDEQETLHLDILKIPHHGSKANITPDFFEKVTADHYVFSGDGKHGNPERATLEMLAAARKNHTMFKIHLTYQIDDIDRERQKDWLKEQTKEKKRKAKKPDAAVRDDWSPEKHGLRAFFNAHPALEKQVSIVVKGAPHLIDLGDPIKP